MRTPQEQLEFDEMLRKYLSVFKIHKCAPSERGWDDDDQAKARGWSPQSQLNALASRYGEEAKQKAIQNKLARDARKANHG